MSLIGWETRIESLRIDLRRAVRGLKRSPAFAVVTAATLALGIGAATAVFSVVRPVLLQSLPYPDADRLISIAEAGDTRGTPIEVTFGTFLELAARSRSIQSSAVTRSWQPTLAGYGEAERLVGQSVSADYFRVLGVRPAVGRDFSQRDDRPGAPQVAIIADSLWRRRFGADANAIGRTAMLDGAAVTIIGVMPRTFENVWSAQAQIWRPLSYDPSLPVQGREWGHHLQLIARLRTDSDVDTVSRELAAIARTPVAAFSRPPSASLSGGLFITPLQDLVTEGVTPVLRSVTIGALFLLVIAAANAVNLMLARSTARRTELATCAALGAARGRLLTPLVGEAVILALIGGILGVVLAYVMVDILIKFEGFALPRIEAIHVDVAALALAAVLSTSIGLIAGCIPGVSLSSRTEAVGSGSRVTRGHYRLRRGFVAAEVALAMVLLIGAGLLVRSVRHLLEVPSGFRADGVLTLQLQTAGPEFRSPDRVRAFFSSVREAVQRVPGVSTVALTSQLPLAGDGDMYGAGTKDDTALPPDTDPSANRYAISANYLETMGIALERGRTLTDQDRSGGQPVALISASAARRRFPGRDPIGQQLRLGPPDNWFTVVGVVGDVRQSSLATSPPDAVYVPASQWRSADRAMWVVIRATVDPATIEASVRQAIRGVNPNQPILQLATMDQRIAASMARQRLVMTAFDAFALVALLLATIGIYGVLTGGVIERRQEIAVRMAVGASRARIVGLIGRQALGMAVVGMVGGGAVAATISRGLITLLFEVSPIDGLTFVAVAVVLLTAAFVSAFVPAWRASRITPAVALESS